MINEESAENYPHFNDLAYVYPPDLQKSQKHRLANRIFRKVDVVHPHHVEVCQCCGKYVGQDSKCGTVCYDTLVQLSYLGPGVPLVFTFLVNVIATVLFLILIVGLLCLILNILSTCQPGKICHQRGVLASMAITDAYINVNNFQLYIYMIFIFTIIWIFLNQWMVYRCRDVMVKADEDSTTPSDFAIFLLGLPDDTTKEDIEEMLEDKRERIKRKLLKTKNEETKLFLQQFQNFKIEMIIFPYKIMDYMVEQLEQEKQFIECVKKGNQQEFCRKIQKKPSNKCNKAIIIFEKQITKDIFLLNTGFYKQVKQFFCNCSSDPNTYIVKNQKIRVARASQPEDIIWQNLQTDYKTNFYNKAKTMSFGILILIVGGVIQFGFSVWQVKSSEPDLNRFVIILSSLVIQITNYILEELLIWATKKEGNITKSKFNASLNIKVCLFQFFNTGIFYILSHVLALLVVHRQNFRQNMKPVLVTNITVFMILNAISGGTINILLDLFQFPNSLFRMLQKHGYRKYSQKQSNQIHELRDSDIPSKYAYLIKTLWLTCFFTPAVPIVSFVSLFGLLFFYLTTKISFRHFYKITSVRSHQTNIRALRLSYFSPFLLNLGMLLLYFFFKNSMAELSTVPNIFLFLSLAISFVYGLLPWYHLNEYLYPLKVKSHKEYKKQKHKFEVTYDNQLINPFGDKHVIKNQNYFLLSQLRRASIREHFDYNQVLEEVLRANEVLESDNILLSCQRLISNKF